MEGLSVAFVVLAMAVLIYQSTMLGLLYRQVNQATKRMTQIANDLHEKTDPILTKLRVLIDDVQPRVSSIAADTAEIAHVARGQAYKVDRVFSEAVDRLRLQVIRADQLLTGALENLEEAGTQVKKSVLGPVQQAAAILQGVKAGIEVFRGMRRSPERTGEKQDEELFI